MNGRRSSYRSKLANPRRDALKFGRFASVVGHDGVPRCNAAAISHPTASGLGGLCSSDNAAGGMLHGKW